MNFQRYLLLSDVHGNVDGIRKLLHARYSQKHKFQAIIISGDFPVTTPLTLVLTYMLKNFNLSRLGYSTKVYKEELRDWFVKYQLTSIRKMMFYLTKFELPIMFIPGNIETTESIKYLKHHYPYMLFLDNDYIHFQDSVNIFGLGGSLDHHGVVCDYEFPQHYFKAKTLLIDQKIQQLDEKIPLIFIFHEPPAFTLAKDDVIKIKLKAKKRGYSYEFTEQAGSTDLLNLTEKYNPRLVINGHFHEYQGVIELEKSVIINPGALATYNYGIVSINLSQEKKYKMDFFKIRSSPFNFTNFLYNKRNFISNEIQFHS